MAAEGMIDAHAQSSWCGLAYTPEGAGGCCSGVGIYKKNPVILVFPVASDSLSSLQSSQPPFLSPFETVRPTRGLELTTPLVATRHTRG